MGWVSRATGVGLVLAGVLLALGGNGGLASAQVRPGLLQVDGVRVYYPQDGTGFDAPYDMVRINDHGQASASFQYYSAGAPRGNRAVRWTFGQTEELLGVTGSPFAGDIWYSYALQINNSGQIAGHIFKADSSGVGLGYQPVRWDPGSLQPVELGHLSTTAPHSLVAAINDAGVIGGYSTVGLSASNNLGFRPVRWEAGSLTATELQVLGTNAAGWTTGGVMGLNQSGAAVGWVSTWDSSGNSLGGRPVRWDAGTTAATPLTVPVATGAAELLACEAFGINDAGVVYGLLTERWEGPDQSAQRAIRWDSAGNATILEQPGFRGAEGSAWVSQATDINSSGDIVGWSEHWDASGNFLGYEALKWAAGSATPTVLDSGGPLSNGMVNANAYTISESGMIGGTTSVEDSTTGLVSAHAVVWQPDGTMVDLNEIRIETVLNGGGTWQLSIVTSLAADGWAAGYGTFDADGAGTAYYPVTTQWSAQLGFGGRVVPPPPGVLMRWSDGRNWSTGTPALGIGRAIFDHPGLSRMVLDRIVETLGVEVLQGTVSLDLDRHFLTVGERLRIGAGSRMNLRTLFDPENDLGGHFFGDILNEGTLSPGNSPGLLSMSGDLVSTGVLEFEIAGTGPGEFDQLWLNGLLDASGTFRVVLDGYTPVLGDEFDLVDWVSWIDRGLQFDFSTALLDPGLVWDTTGFSDQGILRIVAVPEPTLGWVGGGLVLLLCRTRNRRREGPLKSPSFQ